MIFAPIRSEKLGSVLGIVPKFFISALKFSEDFSHGKIVPEYSSDLLDFVPNC